MNNYDLYLKFIEISSLNPFDAYIQLKDLQKTYKKSEFYKQTKFSIKKAYALFLKMMPVQLVAKLHELTDTDRLGIKISDLLNSIDEDAINNVFDKFVNMFDINRLQEEKGDLKILLNQFKDLVK